MQNIDVLINLIKAVKNHPKLFMNASQNDDQDDNTEWGAVANECKMTIAEAQDQWNMLLLEYVEYLRNNQDFDLAQHMHFLQPYFFTIKDDESIDEDELLEAIDCKNTKENNDINTVSTKVEENVDTPSKIEEMKKQPEKPKDNEISSKLQNTETKVAESQANEVQSQNNTFTNLSSLELIFLGYAKQLQKMPLKLQLKIKRKIADIMDEAELEMMS